MDEKVQVQDDRREFLKTAGKAALAAPAAALLLSVTAKRASADAVSTSGVPLDNINIK